MGAYPGNVEIATSGQYQVWVGAIDQQMTITGTLNITEVPDNHPQ